MLTVTTSWDDGDVLDNKLAALLDRYQLKGTFYVAKEYRPARLSEEEILALAGRHEIGAHTLTHPNLCLVSWEQKVAEVAGSKRWLEEVLGAEVPMFCYPAGHFDQEVERAVHEAGYRGARTTAYAAISPTENMYQMPTTVQVYPMPFRKIDAQHYWWGKLLQPLAQRGAAFRTLGVPVAALRSFEQLACAAFDIAHKRGEVYHLWGHSWEIEKYGMWDELERVCQYISRRADCRYVTNGELL